MKIIFTRGLAFEKRTLPKKLFLTMKLTALLLLITFLQVSAHVDAQKITYAQKTSSLKGIFKEIRKQTGYEFLYNTDMVAHASVKDLNYVKTPLKKVLNSLFKGKGLTYSIVGKTIVVRRKTMLPKVSLAEAADIKVDGTVKDKVSGVPLAGVSIKIEGKSEGTTTDGKGHFNLEVSEDASLVISYLGYKKKVVNVNSRSEINISLEPTSTSLNKVVVTAMGISRKEKALGYAVSEVSGDNFTKAREPNVANALEGRVAGVNVTKPVTGSMGSSRVVIRGNGSFNGNNQPLYVVDGIPIVNNNYGQISTFYGGTDGGDGISSINPDDIKSMTVLKGGTAAAIYGARASNGAIIITTKSGSAREGIGVELNSTFTFEQPVFNNSDVQYKYGQGINGQAPQTQQQAFQIGAAGWGAKLDGSDVVQFDGVKRLYSPVKNNVKNYYKGANTFTNTLSFYGGSEDLNFRFSMSDLNNHDLMPNSKLRRNNFTLSTNAKLGNKVDLRLSAMYVRQRVHNRPHGADYSWNQNTLIYGLPANVDVRDLKGVDHGLDEDRQEYLFSQNIYFANPYFIAYHEKNSDAINRFIGSADIKYHITNNFYARALLGMDISNRKSKGLTPPSSAIAPGSISHNDLTSGEFDGQFTVGYNKRFSGFSIDAFVGGHLMRSTQKSLSAGGSNFVVPGFFSLNNTSKSNKSYNLTEKQVNSLLGSIEFGIRDNLFITVTGRNDWFSTLNPSNNNIFYPSVSVSDILSQQMALPDWVSFLKIRGAWAQTGSDSDIPPYSQSLTYGVSGKAYLGQPLGSVSTGTIPNKTLKPSTTKSYEVGFDSRFFHDRFGVHFTWYNRRTLNDILSGQISQTSGFSNVRLNVGEIQNKGIEVLFTGTPIQKPSFEWKVTLNGGYNFSKVKELLPGQNSFQVAQSRTGLYSDGGVPAYIYQVVGKPYGVIEGSSYVRDDDGKIVYEDNGLPEVGPIKKIGQSIPPMTAGLTNHFTYHNLFLDVLIDGKFGGDFSAGTVNLSWYTGAAKATLPGRETGVVGKGVTKDGEVNTQKVPAMQYYGYIANNIAEQFVFSSDFIKLRQVTLGYRLPSAWLNKAGIRGISVSFVARNLATLMSDVPMIDPESSYQTGNTQGFELLSLPATRSFGVNLDLKF